MAAYIVFVSLLGVFAFMCAGELLPLEVETEFGWIKGKREYDPDVVAFYNVPFASPPVGNLRFRPPVAPAPWNSTRDCSQEDYDHVCFQNIADAWIGQEDCLYLNIYVPAIDIQDPLAVMFWIYGGGFNEGDSYEFGFYHGKYLAAKRGVIIVEHNYRLSTAGFLALPGLLEESGTTGNYGTMDQLFALQFVSRNIHQFLGNPEAVTIFGQSAGAFSVCWHVANPGSKGLFRAAIMESGSCASREFFVTLPRAYSFAQVIVNQTGCGGVSDPVACLRGLDILQITNITWPLQTSSTPPLAPNMPWGPAIDGVALPARPIDAIRAGNFNRVPILAGTTLNETTVLVDDVYSVVPNLPKPINEYGYNQVLSHFFNDTAVSLIQDFYPPQTYPSYKELMSVVCRDYFFPCATRASVRAAAAYGVPVYLYQFTYKVDHWVDYDLLGDYHTLELPFVFDHQWPAGLHDFNADDQAVSDAMTLYWSNFAKYLDPNYEQGSNVFWPVYNQTTDLSLNIAKPFSVVEHLLGSTCDFWENLYPNYD